ncbi:MAG: excinuclease ABC subunit UvrA [Planctomycetes bacterium]|nr:excinuclease ABC subunit UvrA [Planctomycetota bacterium]
MARKFIRIRGAREHNLKNIDVDIPRDKFVVVTGLSGSGKSSLAFDTIYAEGQRRYVESLSAYARQFLEQMQKPDVEYIEGLPPTISIEQRSGMSSPRSIVATTTEIYDYLRLLYARVGVPYCYICGRRITQQTPQQIVDDILAKNDPGTRIMILAPLVRGRKGEHREVLQAARREGFVRVRLDGKVTDIDQVGRFDKRRKHTIEVVIDRLMVQKSMESRLSDSIELALRMGSGIAIVSRRRKSRWSDKVYSELYACPHCMISIEELSPRMFSFNSPYGACPTCGGLGTRMEFDPDLIIPDWTLSLKEGAVEAWRRGGKRMAIWYNRILRRFARDFGADLKIPIENLDKNLKSILVNGTTEKDRTKYGAAFEGVIPNLTRRFNRTESAFVKSRLHGYMSELPCPDCGGARLRPEVRSVKVGGKPIHEVTAMTVEAAYDFFHKLRFSREKAVIARQILKEIRQRLTFMRDVGLGYLTLDRTSSTLSGGEAQRIRLATQVGSGLVGVCYVLDEPSIGLHQRDNNRLLETLRRLRDTGNTVIVVEHDEETIRSADHIVDLGPGAGLQGGEVVATGSVEDIEAAPQSLTGMYLSGAMRIEMPLQRRKYTLARSVEVKRAREHNLKGINVKFPLGVFTCVTGVSGSGKSTLVSEILYKALRRRLHRSKDKPGAHGGISGAERIDRVIQIDQSPIGRTPRSNPATYTNVFDHIRKLYAMTREARIRGYKPGRFSFNVKGGRCEACQGQGVKRIEMHFLPDVFVTCQECKGSRYNSETLQVRYKGRSISDVLEMKVSEAVVFFANFPKIKEILQTLVDVGLGYMPLGQPSTTLSGGEAQRVKLSEQLSRRSMENTLYILDEPTTGLHFDDIRKLLNVLNCLVDRGNTVVVIEHNMDVIKCADYIIDLGPEGGDGGGKVVVAGPPETIARCPQSYTGAYLTRYVASKKAATA